MESAGDYNGDLMLRNQSTGVWRWFKPNGGNITNQANAGVWKSQEWQVPTASTH
ncbi:MAG: hypothetical protein ABW168_27770 [Sedimenticola sp.]